MFVHVLCNLDVTVNFFLSKMKAFQMKSFLRVFDTCTNFIPSHIAFRQQYLNFDNYQMLYLPSTWETKS